MPEGHTIHRLARDHRELFAGKVLSVSSPQGRFAGASLLNGARLENTEAFGKHLFYRFEDDRWIHVHLGLFGKVWTYEGGFGAGRPSARVRLSRDRAVAEIVGPTTCELVAGADRESILGRLGPDPLREDADPTAAWGRLSASRRPVAALLMDQRVLAGVGNVYRAEVLFRASLDPLIPGRDLHRQQWEGVWVDLRTMMKAGVRANRIVTTRPEDRERSAGRARAADATYVYGRVDLPCRRCGTTIRRTEIDHRRLYWCPSCQRR